MSNHVGQYMVCSWELMCIWLHEGLISTGCHWVAFEIFYIACFGVPNLYGDFATKRGRTSEALYSHGIRPGAFYLQHQARSEIEARRVLVTKLP